jgi:hypothetical protein
MAGQLERQLRLLEEYSRRAFEHGEEDFLPEVAGKLRILIVRSRSNRPLLFEVADKLGVVPEITLGGPPVRGQPGEPGPGDTIPLDEFFDLDAVTIRTSSGLVTMTKRKLVAAWCQQLGGVHEDWSVEEALVNAVRFPIRIFGMQLSSIELSNTARITLHHGRILLERGRELGTLDSRGGDAC